MTRQSKTQTVRTFVAARDLLPGDRLLAHRVTVTSVEHQSERIVSLGYSHTTTKGAWFATRRFHVERAA